MSSYFASALGLMSLAVVCGATPAPDAGRTVTFLFGPADAASASQSARTAASVCRRWMKDGNASAGLFRGGVVETITPDKARAKALDDTFAAAAKDAADSDPATFISQLDDAVAGLKHQQGTRIVVGVLNPPALAGDSEESLKRIIDYASSNAVRIVILDASGAKRSGDDIWSQTGSGTGGAVVQNARALDAALLSIAGSIPAFANTQPEPKQAAVAATVAAAPPADLPTAIPVKVRFIQISHRNGGTSYRTAVEPGNTGSFDSMNMGEADNNVEGGMGPLHGWLIVEAPLKALHFNEDDTKGVYYGHVIVTETVRNENGKVAWTARKDVVSRGPLSNMRDRRAGNVYYMRDIMLPNGKYTLEATVDDQLAGKRGAVREPLQTGANVPGLMVSDALLVRPFHGSVDKFEADTNLAYEGNSLSPLIEPVYPANQPFDVQMFVILYPDIYGVQPEITIEVLRDGKVLTRASVPFKSIMRHGSMSDKSMSMSMLGGMQHGFDYLAAAHIDKLDPGEYEARVIVQQSKNVVARSAMFRVAEPGPASPAGEGK